MSSPYKGGMQELRPLPMAGNVYEAVSLWWAQAILKVHIDLRTQHTEHEAEIRSRLQREEKLREAALVLRPKVQKHIAGFTVALTELTIGKDITKLSVGLTPDVALQEAANAADLPLDNEFSIFPPFSHTEILDTNTLAVGKLGGRGLQRRIWPPVRRP